MEKKFNLLLRSYLNESTIAQSTVERYGGGHINETYLVTTPDEKLILQKLNTYVFKTPVDVKCIRSTSDNVKITKIDNTTYAVEIPATEFVILSY
jgi:hypothetical protein